MSLIKCPECGKEISDKAYECPNCKVLLKNNFNKQNILQNNTDIKKEIKRFMSFLHKHIGSKDKIIFTLRRYVSTKQEDGSYKFCSKAY